VKLVPVLWTVETIGSLIDMQVFIRLLHLMADNTLNLLKLSLSKENFDLEVRGFHIRLLKLRRFIELVLLPHRFKVVACNLLSSELVTLQLRIEVEGNLNF